MVGVFNSLIASLQSVLSYFSTEIASIAIGLAFIMSLIRVVGVLWQKGYDQLMPYVKEQLTRFFIVVALCLPFNIGQGSGSFITMFPTMVVSGGLVTGEAVASTSDGAKLRGSAGTGTGGGASNSLITLPRNLQAGIENSRGVTSTQIAEQARGHIENLKNSSPGLWDMVTNGHVGLVKAVGYFLGLLAVTSLPMIFIGIAGGPAGIGIAVMLFIVNLILALALAFNSTAILEGELASAMSWLAQTAVRGISDFVFTSVLTFAYYGVLLSTLIKGGIYVVTFPISVVNMAFDKQKDLFVKNIIKGFGLAIVPLLAAAIFVVAVNGYVLLTADGGLVSTMIEVYVGDMQTATTTSFMSFLGYYFRWLTAIFLAPTALTVPIARYMLMTPTLAQELIGASVSGAGITERMKGMGSFGMGGKV